MTERCPRPIHTVFFFFWKLNSHCFPQHSPRTSLQRVAATLPVDCSPVLAQVLFSPPVHLPCSLPPHSSPLTRGFWFLAATTGRAAPPLRRVFVGPFRRRQALGTPAHSPRFASLPTLRGRAPQTLSKLFLFGSDPIASMRMSHTGFAHGVELKSHSRSRMVWYRAG